MAWAFTWSLWLTVAAGLLGLASLFWVIRARIPGRAGIAFILLLTLESINFMADGGAWLLHFSRPRIEAGLTSVAVVSGIMMAPAYLLFLRHAGATRATRWLTGGGGWFVVGYAIVYALFALGVLTGLAQTWPWWILVLLQISNLAVYMLALVAGFLSFTGASPGTSGRRRGAALLLAFGARDVAWIVGSVGPLSQLILDASMNAPGTATSLPMLYILYGVVGIVYFPAVVYAMLSGRLLDLDQRFRFGLTQTTAAAMVGGFFLVFTEVVEANIQTNSSLFSVLVAVVLAFLFRPIQRIAARLTRRLFPAPPAGGNERAFFEQQLALALEDGTVSPKERRMLDHVARRIGISTDEAKRMETTLRARIEAG